MIAADGTLLETEIETLKTSFSEKKNWPRRKRETKGQQTWWNFQVTQGSIPKSIKIRANLWNNFLKSNFIWFWYVMVRWVGEKFLFQGSKGYWTSTLFKVYHVWYQTWYKWCWDLVSNDLPEKYYNKKLCMVEDQCYSDMKSLYYKVSESTDFKPCVTFYRSIFRVNQYVRPMTFDPSKMNFAQPLTQLTCF